MLHCFAARHAVLSLHRSWVRRPSSYCLAGWPHWTLTVEGAVRLSFWNNNLIRIWIFPLPFMVPVITTCEPPKCTCRALTKNVKWNSSQRLRGSSGSPGAGTGAVFRQQEFKMYNHRGYMCAEGHNIPSTCSLAPTPLTWMYQSDVTTQVSARDHLQSPAGWLGTVGRVACYTPKFPVFLQEEFPLPSQWNNEE